MARLAGLLAEALPPAQRTFDDAGRTDWAYFPAEHPGARFGDFGTEERVRLFQLLGTGLSVAGLAKVSAVMALEPVLDHLEGSRMAPWRDMARYMLSVWGTPGADGTWAWRFEGHHVSIHVTVVDGEVVGTTPFFLGANPATVTAGGHVVTRPCGAEEDAGRSLLAALDGDQRTLAVLHHEAPPDVVLRNAPEVPDAARPDDVDRALWFERDAPRGVAASALDGRQLTYLTDLVDVYLDRLTPELAAIERRRFDAAGGTAALSFAWAGSEHPGEPHYYRVQGPSMLIEYDDAQDGANHVHAVWRDPGRDFGRDPLREHKDSHHH